MAKRALFSGLPLEIGPGFKISVKGYVIFKRQQPKRSCYIWLDGDKPQIAKASTTQIADDTARTIEKAEIKKAYKFGGEQIVFTPEEASSLRNFGEPGIRIIGFKPLDKLEIWASMKPSTFIYPSEEEYVGSTRVFSALQQKLLKDRLMGLAWFIPRKNAAAVIAAIIPGAEKLSDEGEQLIPPGLWLVPLPFADDVRADPEVPVVVAPEGLINSMRTIIQQLQLPKAQYAPDKYPNPCALIQSLRRPVLTYLALQWHYRILQALALEEDIPEKPVDATIPKYKQINKVSSRLCPSLATTSSFTYDCIQRAGPYIEDWRAELDELHQKYQMNNRSSNTLVKRPGPSSKDAAEPKKRAKTEEGDTVINDDEMRAHFKKNSIGKVRVRLPLIFQLSFSYAGKLKGLTAFLFLSSQ